MLCAKIVVFRENGFFRKSSHIIFTISLLFHFEIECGLSLNKLDYPLQNDEHVPEIRVADETLIYSNIIHAFKTFYPCGFPVCQCCQRLLYNHMYPLVPETQIMDFKEFYV